MMKNLIYVLYEMFLSICTSQMSQNWHFIHQCLQQHTPCNKNVLNEAISQYNLWFQFVLCCLQSHSLLDLSPKVTFWQEAWKRVLHLICTVIQPLLHKALWFCSNESFKRLKIQYFIIWSLRGEEKKRNQLKSWEQFHGLICKPKVCDCSLTGLENIFCFPGCPSCPKNMQRDILWIILETAIRIF